MLLFVSTVSLAVFSIDLYVAIEDASGNKNISKYVLDLIIYKYWTRLFSSDRGGGGRGRGGGLAIFWVSDLSPERGLIFFFFPENVKHLLSKILYPSSMYQQIEALQITIPFSNPECLVLQYGYIVIR